jgi:hypothetical protein
MNHKRNRPKQRRAGCLLCKPNKLGKGMEKKLGHRGFGKLRKEAAARQDLSEATISGAPGDDAMHYQVRAVKRAVEESKS